MDCRKWLPLAAGLVLGVTGCVTEQQDFNNKTRITVWTPWSMFQKESKREPQVETCLKAGEVLETQAETDKLDATAREEILERARKAYQQALEYDANNVGALAGLARIHASLHEFDRAQAAYDKALKLHPKDAQVLAEVGLFYFRQKQYDQAADSYRKAMEANPNERAYAKHLSLNLALAGREHDCVEVLTKLYGPAQAHFDYALLALKALNQPDAARHHLQQVLRHAAPSDKSFLAAQLLLAQLNQGNSAFIGGAPALPPAPAAPTLPAADGAPTQPAASPMAGLGFRGD
jgi:tetratricopeptide (TPR) repeat protein